MAQPTMAAVPGLKDTYVQLKTRMDKAVDDFRKALVATRTGRASVNMLDGVSVEAYGSQMALNQVATVHSPEALVRRPEGFARACQPCCRAPCEGYKQNRRPSANRL